MRDPRGFAVKFYTEEGNYDLVGNNLPVFFIRDAIKFPDMVHAFKGAPDNNMPSASSAHNLITDLMHIDKPIQQRVAENLTKADPQLGKSVVKGLKI